MDQDRSSAKPIEHALLELHEAENAGVFERTAVDAKPLLNPGEFSSRARFAQWSIVGLPVAACLALAIGVGSWMFQAEFARIRAIRDGRATVVAMADGAGDGGALPLLDPLPRLALRRDGLRPDAALVARCSGRTEQLLQRRPNLLRVGDALELARDQAIAVDDEYEWLAL